MGIHNRCGLAENGKGAGLLAHSLHADLVLAPDVAVVEAPRSEIARVDRFTCADVIAESFDYGTERAAMTAAAPTSAPVRFVREDTPGAVVVDEPDLAPLIHLHGGVTISDLVEEETPAVGTE